METSQNRGSPGTPRDIEGLQVDNDGSKLGGLGFRV